MFQQSHSLWLGPDTKKSATADDEVPKNALIIYSADGVWNEKKKNKNVKRANVKDEFSALYTQFECLPSDNVFVKPCTATEGNNNLDNDIFCFLQMNFLLSSTVVLPKDHGI